MPATRIETDSFGAIEVPVERLWGAQTARSLRFFAISEERMPRPVVYALARVKRAAAGVNSALGLLDALNQIAQPRTIDKHGRVDLGDQRRE